MPRHDFPKTWILVADAAQANAWEAGGRDGPLSPVADFRLAAGDTHGFARDLKSDRPGRAFSSTDNRRSAMEPPHDPHEQAKARFTDEVAARLDEACRQQRFSRLVVAAPPRMLGILRKSYGGTLERCIAGDIDRDLTKATPAEILDHVRDILHAIGSGQ